ncbi:MAG TPA: tetratricopeptide repeat protein [Candidatus Eremiobacteraeota bacterium]|nr:MAG: Tetratricopeptide repeat protein [bacterium ADurb.Bin363]HPZ09565.1 tetratricopeptide repeat protein [Candidatus Eremiobacteraeota bacterium]
MYSKIFTSLILVSLFILMYSLAYSQSTAELVRKAENYYNNENYKDAKRNAQMAIEANPNLIEAHKFFVDSSKFLKELDKCLTYYMDKCNKIWFWDKNKPSWLYGLGLAYIANGQSKEAEEAFNSALKLAPKSRLADDIQKVAGKNKLSISFPATSLNQDIQRYSIIGGLLLVLIIFYFVYKIYEERKTGERQVAQIKKDRRVNFFGKKRY